MHFFSKDSKVLWILLLLLFIPAAAYGDEGDRGGSAVTLGWFAIGAGLVANFSLVVFKVARKIPVLKLAGGTAVTQGLAPLYRPVLNFHIMLNSIGYFAGLYHGLMLIRGLDAISLSLVIVMTLSMVSGIILRYASGKELKIFGRLVHGQFILGVLLLALTALHVITHGADFD